MAKGCMAVPWGHLLGDTKLFRVSGSGFKAYPWRRQMFYDIIFVRVSYGAGMNSIIKRKFPSNNHNIFMTKYTRLLSMPVQLHHVS